MRSSTQHAVYFLIIVVTSIIVSVFWIEFLSGFKKEIQAFKFINIIAKKNSTKPMNKAIESKTNSTYVILIYNGHLKLFMEHFRKKKCPLVKKKKATIQRNKSILDIPCYGNRALHPQTTEILG